MGTSLLTDPSNNIIILEKLKRKIKEINTIKKNITNLLLYVLVFFILLVAFIIVYIVTYNRKWLGRIKVKSLMKNNLPRTTHS
jgi:ABC-type antimicrobial peptide transport system permease subunit